MLTEKGNLFCGKFWVVSEWNSNSVEFLASKDNQSACPSARHQAGWAASQLGSCAAGKPEGSWAVCLLTCQLESWPIYLLVTPRMPSCPVQQPVQLQIAELSSLVAGKLSNYWQTSQSMHQGCLLVWIARFEGIKHYHRTLILPNQHFFTVNSLVRNSFTCSRK